MAPFGLALCVRVCVCMCVCVYTRVFSVCLFNVCMVMGSKCPTVLVLLSGVGVVEL